MTELVRNEARPLEISVTVQGSKTVDGTEQRELFTETTNTTLVFDNGAVLKLNARVTPGQCVFLRNDRSEREILCKVLESRQAGYTDLEFTVYDPNFWYIPAEQPAAAAPTPEPQKEIEAPMVVSDPAPTVESGSSTSDEIPVTVPETWTTAPARPSPEATDESIPPDWDEAKDAELHAVLAAMEASSKGQPESSKKETKQTAPETSAEVGKQSETSSGKAGSDKTTSNTTSEAKVLSSPTSQTHRLRELIATQNPIAVRIAASLLIVGALGFAWHAIGGLFHSNQPSVASTQSRPQAPAGTPASQTPASTSATNANNAGASPSQSTQKIQPTQAQSPVAAVAQRPATTTANAGAGRENKGTEDSAAPAAPKVVSADQATPIPAINTSEMKTGGITPAKIVSQTPPTLPEWAKDLDMAEVVKLDALIDEKGNVVEAKPLSGPRLLQAAAERAVTLWVFEPALSDGKPIASRMVLTVQFQE
jgi:Gram-negative bacterial TonB protein C-terminal